MKYPRIIKNSKLAPIFEHSLQLNILNTIQRENNFLHNLYNSNTNTNANTNTNFSSMNMNMNINAYHSNTLNSSVATNLNKKIIEESVASAVSVFFRNFLSKFF